MLVFPPCCYGGVPTLVCFAAGCLARLTIWSTRSVPVVVAFHLFLSIVGVSLFGLF